MAWTHCGVEVIDTAPCPSCGLSKAEWTVQLDRTRTFQVPRATRKQRRRDAWIELELRDAAGRPAAGAEFRVALADGRVREGALGEDGAVRLEELPEGPCDVSFPGRLDAGVERSTGARHVFGGAALVVGFDRARAAPGARVVVWARGATPCAAVRFALAREGSSAAAPAGEVDATADAQGEARAPWRVPGGGEAPVEAPAHGLAIPGARYRVEARAGDLSATGAEPLVAAAPAFIASF